MTKNFVIDFDVLCAFRFSFARTEDTFPHKHAERGIANFQAPCQGRY